MRERTVNIGRPLPLVGVLAEPSQVDPTKPIVLILNSGVMHHIGSCRVSVKLARALAKEAGLVSLRFDFSAVGDSEPRRGGPSFDLNAVEEVREVMDFLQQSQGVGRFILYGLCSGARTGFNTALCDERVIALAQIDGISYLTPKWYANHYLPRMMSPLRWQGMLKKLLGDKANSGVKRSGADIAGIEEQYFEVPDFASTPPKYEISSGYQLLAKRKVQLFCAFTDSEEYNYLEQFRDGFSAVDFSDLLDLEYWPNTSHIMSELRSQVVAVEHLTHWMNAVAQKTQ